MVSHWRHQPGSVSVQVRRVRSSPCSDGIMFWTNHVESRVGVVTLQFGRQMHCYAAFYVSFDKRVKTIGKTFITPLRETVEPLKAENINTKDRRYSHSCRWLCGR